MPFNSVCAWARLTSSRRRPNTWRYRDVRLSSGTGTSGIHISACDGNIMPSGMTPMIVAGLPSMRSVLPMTLRSSP